MSARKNLVGLKVGRLVIEKYEPASLSQDRYSRYVCRCECGNTVKVITADLVSGNTQSCGCLRKELLVETIANRCSSPRIDLVGHRSGKLLVVKLVRIEQSFLWKCSCDCGKSINLTTQQIKRIDSPRRSCGCNKPRKKTGKKAHSSIPKKIEFTPIYSAKPITSPTKFVPSTELADEQIECLKKEHARIINSIKAAKGVWAEVGICEEWQDFGKFAGWVESNLPPIAIGLKLTRISRYNDFCPGNVKWAS